MAKGKQLIPTWVCVLGIIVIVLGIGAVFLVEESKQEDRRTCRALEEAYPDPDGGRRDC